MGTILAEAAMARRVRPGLVGGSRALAVLGAAGLVAALVLVGRSLDGGGAPERRGQPAPAAAARPPVPVGGELECPAGWPVLATSDHRSWPAGHPAQPAAGNATAVACYRTAAQAAAAGYPPAPPPPGALEVAGVYLAPTSQAFRASCRRVADRLGFGAPCPWLLPTPPPGVPWPRRLCEEPRACQRGQVLRFVQEAFVVPFGYVGAPAGHGALMIVATPADGGDTRPGLRCPDERRVATPAVHGARAVLAACPEDAQGSLFAGSLLLRWSQRGALVVVSMLGHSEANQRLLLALADHLRIIPPRS